MSNPLLIKDSDPLTAEVGLRENGFKVTLIDCLDFNIKSKKYGEGKFFKIKIEKPFPLKSIPRNYSQYGIPEEMLLKRLSFIEEKPDLIGITSGMTYWYPVVFKIIEIIREFFQDVPIILCGIYATLCYEHAKKHSGADVVFKSGNEWDALKLISELTCFKLRTDIYPAFDLYPQLDYICIATSKGCPYRCTYCASSLLSGSYVRRDSLQVVEEIKHWTTQYQVNNIAFYDDALLIEPSKNFVPIIKEIIKRGIRCYFHTPNALHIKEIDEEVEETIVEVRETGAKPMLVEYSPIPHTPLFEKAKRISSFDIENEPLYHNNSLLPCQWEGFVRCLIFDSKQPKFTHSVGT